MIRDSRHRQPNGQPHTEYIWYLPTTRQDGTLQPPAAIEQAHQAIAQMGKNIQRFRPCRGNWITAKGHLVQDTLIPVLIEAPARPETHNAMLALAADMATKLGHDTILVLAQDVK